MPLVVESLECPAIWPDDSNPFSPLGALNLGRQAECIDIALINNMPDLALEDTEAQFCKLLSRAAERLAVRLKLFSLPNIARSERAQKYLDRHYRGINELWETRFDALIVTGTEPCQADLRREAYWPALVDVLDWAEENTSSAILSCLAAHAGVLHSDGIGRRPLSDKRFGVFAFSHTAAHPLTKLASGALPCPHSRWNEVRASHLTSSGYSVLTQSEEAGVDLFVKKKRKSLFLHFQGHPEYGVLTLLREYRRDTRRFLKRERETYPTMPYGYFDAAGVRAFEAFREQALASPSDELMARFPEAAGCLQNSWEASATGIYRNWLDYVVAEKENALSFAAMPGTKAFHTALLKQEFA